MKQHQLILLFILFLIIPSLTHARSTYNWTISAFALGNIQLLETLPELAPGPGGGIALDYRFNQRFGISVESWASDHDGEGVSSAESGIQIMAIPAVTLKLFLIEDENSRWDPFIGMGLGVYAVTEGSIPNGTNGVGLGAQIDVGVDYYFSDLFSAGFSGVFRSAGIINNLDNNTNNATAIIPYSLVARFGYHF